jgi:hypothetical protein
MTERRKLITVLMGALALCASVHADMMPVSPVDIGCQASPQAGAAADLPPYGFSGSLVESVATVDLPLLPVGLLAEGGTGTAQASETKPAQITTDRQNSLSLCLYALLSLGLYRSAPFVKKFNFACIPDWYHTGAPYQIGHSFAISPDCHSPASVVCFVQPDLAAGTQDPLPQHRWGIVASLWRQSQFTPTVLASRGPPSTL